MSQVTAAGVVQPRAAYDQGLARKRMAAGVLFFDGDGRVLLVDPSYKAGWEIPGGVVELDESPRDAARREVREELGLDREPGAVLGVDWIAARPDRSEGLMIVFDGGVLDAAELAGVSVQAEELHGWALVEPADVAGLLPQLQARRVAQCVAARSGAGTVYLENGVPAA